MPVFLCDQDPRLPGILAGLGGEQCEQGDQNDPTPRRFFSTETPSLWGEWFACASLLNPNVATELSIFGGLGADQSLAWKTMSVECSST